MRSTQIFISYLFAFKLFLHSDTRSYDHAALRSRLQPVAFSTVYNHECDWVATCLNPKFRLEAEGSDVPAHENQQGVGCGHRFQQQCEIRTRRQHVLELAQSRRRREPLEVCNERSLHSSTRAEISIS